MKIGIVAHDARHKQAWQLFRHVRADFISLDNGSIGPRANHLLVWERLIEMCHDGEWCVVLEDDAVLCDDFMEQLQTVILCSPTDIISLYLGRRHPSQWQKRMSQAVSLADSRNASWITSSFAIHAVGLAMRHEDAKAFIYDVSTTVGQARPIDDTMSAWCRRTKRTVGYCHPSIVDHADGDTLIKHPDHIEREKGRRAWQFGSRDIWSRVSIPLDPNSR